MEWEKLKYSKSQINHAGKVLVDGPDDEKELDVALNILDNWRAVHSYPLHIFQMTLKNKSIKVDPNSIVAQRLKRVTAILNKLDRSYYGRNPSMKLYQIQDIAGCRAIVSTVSQAKKLFEEHYLKGDLKHKRVGFKDYINNPKADGYRSFHVIYEYKSDKGKKEFNGLRVEIQIRSKIQHLWATAVETVDFFTRQAIKSNEGHPDWVDFFKLVSSAFAKLENCPPIPGMPSNEKELYSQIKQKEKELNVISKMEGWKSALHLFTEKIKDKRSKKATIFLLELDIVGQKLNIKSYMNGQEQNAITDYSTLEKRHEGKKDYDVVLVGVDTANDLQKAYPNYFVDSEEFLAYLKRIITKY